MAGYSYRSQLWAGDAREHLILARTQFSQVLTRPKLSDSDTDIVIEYSVTTAEGSGYGTLSVRRTRGEIGLGRRSAESELVQLSVSWQNPRHLVIVSQKYARTNSSSVFN
jgi:hypothetical protein